MDQILSPSSQREMLPILYIVLSLTGNNSNLMYAQRNDAVGDSLSHCCCKSYREEFLIQKQKI